MLATLKAVKARNPEVSTVFYWYTILAFRIPFYAQVASKVRSSGHRPKTTEMTSQLVLSPC